MNVYLNDEKKSVDPWLHLKRVDKTDRNHCGIQEKILKRVDTFY